ncbi:AhpC/TSA family protein [Pseudoflavitalea sp. G-6-1-2]|uniref:TlpA disulfide reductase family protein n=1 Tax=Pseudoflavitalea sp. G-6-1-2 TaxID=2728841 RepID=UPI00146BEF0C|nr:TlpA disulfide reductase family protein [Pseudoflavitalea sp. G-6-1-2]NML23909.1 AhpC/TSA family protein [Pseudoflavitalea sp. G-6-1-2]
MKKIIMAGMMMGACITATAQGFVTIKGSVTGDLKGYNKIYLYGNDVANDSAEVRNGQFTFKLPYKKPLMALMYAEYTIKNGSMYTPFGLLIDRAGEVTVSNIDLTKGMESGTIGGMQSAVMYQQFNQQSYKAYEQVNKGLEDKFGTGWMQESDPKFKAFEEEREKLSSKYIGEFVQQFVTKHPDSYASVMALSGTGRSVLSLDEQEKLYAKLSSAMKKTEAAKDIPDFIEGARNSAIGSTVKNFTLNTPEDKPLALSAFKGKYLLIDFWASWCMPCKQSFPHMKEVYKAYKSDQFEIYSISIDKNKAAWLKAVKEEAFPWPQSLDNINIAHKAFAVTGVPSTFLIDPSGKIIAKDVGFDPETPGDIEKKLIELFGEKLSKKPTEKKKEGEVIPAARLQ